MDLRNKHFGAWAIDNMNRPSIQEKCTYSRQYSVSLFPLSHQPPLLAVRVRK